MARRVSLSKSSGPSVLTRILRWIFRLIANFFEWLLGLLF